MESVEPTVTSSQEKNGYYKNTITYHRNSASPVKFSITKKSYDFDSYFESIKLFGDRKEILINAETIKNATDNKYMFNISEKYLIRGDKSNTDDGWYEKRQLQAKVTTVLPKFGFVMRFLSSPYGTILIIGLMFIPISYWFFFKKKLQKGKEDAGENEEK